MNDKEYTATANLGAVEIPENMKQYMVELLKLQKRSTPQKPVMVNVGHNGKTDGCPVCGKDFWEKVNFCPNCGQAIDWSDLDEQMA